MRAIIYTSRSGGVAICHPSPECVRLLQGGGAFGKLARGTMDERVAREIEGGSPPDVAKRWVSALALGGNTEADAWGLIRDRDCSRHGTAFDVVDLRSLPGRTFRDAWRRGHNGGPITIDLKSARAIRFRRIRAAIDRHNARAAAELYGPDPIMPRWGSIRDALNTAESVVAIECVGFELNLHGGRA